MRQLVTRVTAALAIAALPAIAHAQSASPQANPAADHLRAARTSLNKVLNTPASGDTFKQLSELKNEYIALEKAASTASPEWSAHYTVIERILGQMLGSSPAAGVPGAVGTSGRAGAAVKPLDATLSTNLQEFREHLSGFSAAMNARTAPAPAAAPAPPAPPSSNAPPLGTTPPVATPPTPVTTAPTTPPVVTPPITPPEATIPVPPSAAAPAVDDVAVQIDQVTALIDRALSANLQATAIPMDRATLEQIKAELAAIKQRVKKP